MIAASRADSSEGASKTSSAAQMEIPPGPGDVERRLLESAASAPAKAIRSFPAASSMFSAASSSDPLAFGDAKANANAKEQAASKSDTPVAGVAGEPAGMLSRHGMAIAMMDLAGQTAPEPDWYRPGRFVCQECLQPCEGLCIGWPISARKCPKTGVTQWIVRGRLGSVGCAMRYATDHRHSFWQESAGLLPLMLVRAYGCKGLLDQDLPLGEARTSLPPFQPELCAKWARGELNWDPAEYHRRMMQPTQAPDPAKHQIVSEHCALLINSHVPRFKLGLSVADLQKMFPGWSIKSGKPQDFAPAH